MPRGPLLPLLTVNLVGAMGFSIVLPFLVFLVTRWGGNALVYGVMGATYSAFQLVGAPVLGRWSDRVGRRKILLLSQAGTFLSWGILLVALFLPVTALAAVESPVLGRFTLTLPLLVLFLARAADGLTGGNVSVANAYLADISDAGDRSANFGKMSAAANLGFILGPALAGLLGALGDGELYPVLAALAISGVAIWIIAFRLPESRPCALGRDPEPPNLRKTFGQEQKPCFQVTEGAGLSPGGAFRLPGVGLLLVLYFLVFLGFNVFYIAFPVHAASGLSWSVTRTGVFFAVLGFFMAVVQGPVLSRLGPRVEDRTLVRAGSLILAASFGCFTVSHDAALYAGAALLALGNGIMWPSVMSLLAEAAGTRFQGAVQGVAGSLGAVASIAGLLAGGLLYGILGARVFLVSGAVILVVFLAALTLKQAPRPE